MSQSVRYSISAENPQAHLFTAQARVQQPDAGGQLVSLPSWIPGSYMIRDFAKNVVDITARCDGDNIAVEKIDKDHWRCAPCDGVLEIEYRVYAWDASVRTAKLDDESGFFNGSSVFLRVHNQEHLPCHVEIKAPGAPVGSDWQVATGLAASNTDDQGFGEYHCENYDALIDHPVLMGPLQRVHYVAGGIEHEMALVGKFSLDSERLSADLARLCEYHISFFQSPAPMQRYVFLVLVTTSGYGGLEHRNSSALMCSREELPAPGMKTMSESYRTFLGLCSHEYFHSWNVKRIRPQAFTPYDLNRENYTRDLWVFEGITSYYDDQALCLCGLIDDESYLELLGQMITRYWRTPGRFVQTLSESSFEAWTKFYKQDENAINAIVSYYTKGALLALCLDLKIRQESNHSKSLDDVMHKLWQSYGMKEQPLPEGGAMNVINEATGLELDDFLHRALNTTEELPLESLLQQAGVQLHARAASGNEDRGGKSMTSDLPVVDFGIALKAGDGSLEVLRVVHDSPAQLAGIAPGDNILAIDGVRINLAGFNKLCQSRQPGEVVTVHLFRDAVLKQVEVELKAAPQDTAWLEKKPAGAKLWFR